MLTTYLIFEAVAVLVIGDLVISAVKLVKKIIKEGQQSEGVPDSILS